MNLLEGIKNKLPDSWKHVKPHMEELSVKETWSQKITSWPQKTRSDINKCYLDGRLCHKVRIQNLMSQALLLSNTHQCLTLPETNITPENAWLEDYFPIGEAYFQGRLLLVSGRVSFLSEEFYLPNGLRCSPVVTDSLAKSLAMRLLHVNDDRNMMKASPTETPPSHPKMGRVFGSQQSELLGGWLFVVRGWVTRERLEPMEFMTLKYL